MDEPKFQPGDRVRHRDGGEFTVVGPSFVRPGCFVVVLTPIPSPDDEVEVVVRMTRAQRDDLAKGGWPDDTTRRVMDACRAHRDAEQAEGGDR